MLKALILLYSMHGTNGHDYYLSFSVDSEQTCQSMVAGLPPGGQNDYDMAYAMRKFYHTDLQKITYSCVTEQVASDLYSKLGDQYVSPTEPYTQ